MEPMPKSEQGNPSQARATTESVEAKNYQAGPQFSAAINDNQASDIVLDQ